MDNYRQEHIYEFIITEKHHCQLLKVIMSSSSMSLSSSSMSSMPMCRQHCPSPSASLKVIQRVFCEGMTQHLDMRPEILDRLFPQVCKYPQKEREKLYNTSSQLDTLIDMHFEFLRQLRERQDQTAVIPTIADILLAQFQEEQAVR